MELNRLLSLGDRGHVSYVSPISRIVRHHSFFILVVSPRLQKSVVVYNNKKAGMTFRSFVSCFPPLFAMYIDQT